MLPYPSDSIAASSCEIKQTVSICANSIHRVLERAPLMISCPIAAAVPPIPKVHAEHVEAPDDRTIVVRWNGPFIDADTDYCAKASGRLRWTLTANMRDVAWTMAG